MTPLEILSLAVVCALLGIVAVQRVAIRDERRERKYWKELASKPKPKWWEPMEASR